MLDLTLVDQSTAQDLGRIADQVRNPVAMLKVIGRRGANELKSHFRARNLEGNKLGGRRSNFWRQIADSVNSPVIEGSTAVRVSITDPRFLQKVFGGTIRAKNAGALTIPVDALSAGRTASVFEHATGIQLFLLRKKGGGMSNLLAGIVSEKEVKVFYVLVKEVDQVKDDNALPPRDRFNAAILDEATQFLDREIRSGTGK
jgi:hypothetical protein